MKQLRQPTEKDTTATIKTNMGEIKVLLLPEAAPKAVENFVTHSKDGYYNGVIFHRIIEDFMIQGGDPTGTGRGGESIYGKGFEDEVSVDYRNLYGALSMANAGPSTNGSQFFIVTNKEVTEDLLSQMRSLGEDGGFPEKVVEAYEKLGGAYWLDGKHTVFGHVYEGMDIVEKIQSVPVGSMDKPIEDVVIESIEIE